MFKKQHSIVVSEIVFNILERQLEGVELKGEKVCEPYLETFYNCREQGYVLCLWRSGKSELNIWAFENRNSDEIVIVVGTGDSDNLPMDEAWRNRQCFHYNEFYEAAEYAKKQIIKYFNGEEK